ncbi:hypothetical protein A1O3_08228 [Capronia epimyces CBS 606.96]|uniref:Cytochrome P450 oxidoreductase n=1 Tax=Capronia epimyces CBS 606.96 TaxID=1182542 RepID=W9XHG0_9EURO|nr:uncharacterized protein A1O3_08228 [Capronia epimyces CBS 606.96]EXJ79942.1 hypothetical protein A1O3_08228 [Capronia epimyces CBS 606.96]
MAGVHPTLTPQSVAISSALAGVASHLGYFIRGEHHLEVLPLFFLAVASPVAAIAGEKYYLGLETHEAVLITAVAWVSYYAALFASIVVYRVFFHRLRRFPGPSPAKVTKLYHVAQVAGRRNNWLVRHAWHQKYGDIVRTGPSELSITVPAAVPLVLGPGSKCTKSDWYDMAKPIDSMHTIRVKQVHDARRKIWDLGFNSKALRSYEGRILKYSHQLVDALSRQTGEPLNATEWFNYYSFDVMGDLAFGKSFDMLSTGKEHFFLQLVHKGQSPVGIFTPAPWLAILLKEVPFAMRTFHRFLAWCELQVEERKKINMAEPDVMSYIIDSANKAQNPQEARLWLQADSRLIIVAGSDTTAATLTNAFYYMIKDPVHLKRLRDELDPIRLDDGTFNFKDLQGAEYLNAVINETLRLQPPVPSGLYRKTPPEGISVNGVYIPGDVTVSVPSYTLGRSEAAFARAEEFIPERWTSKPELVKAKEAFAPFSLGPYSCIGKQLALMELRDVIAQLSTTFNVDWAPGYTGSPEDGMEDIFTVALGKMDVVFTAREGVVA